jgi:hypothetical protein
MDLERLRQFGGSIELRPASLVTIKTEALASLRERYSIAVEEEQIFQEEIDVTVPPGSAVQIVLHWKRIWQEGNVILSFPNGGSLQLPFRLVAGMTFDQTTTDR